MNRSWMMVVAALTMASATVSGARASVISYSGRQVMGGAAQLFLGQTLAGGMVTAGMTTLATPTGAISGFCVALCRSPASNGRYAMTAPRGALMTKDANFLADAADLIAWNDPNDASASEATQIALWRLEYDGVTNGVVHPAGRMTVRAADAQVDEIVAADLKELGYNGGTRRTGPVLSVSELVQSGGRGNANLLVASAAPVAVPEPGAAGVLAVAVGGVVGARRRRG